MTVLNNSYIKEYQILHKSNANFGSGAEIYFPEALLIIDYLKPSTVLDFGCGKASLIKALAERYPNVEFYGYDPAIPGRNILPIEKVDLVICTDVLEHIPENILPSVIEKIANLSNNAFFILHHALAYTILPNGENAHCTVYPQQWYYHVLNKYYKAPYPLPNRKKEISACITFTPSIDFLNTYYDLVSDKNMIIKLNEFEEKLNHLENKLNNYENKLRYIKNIYHFAKKISAKLNMK